MLVEIDGEQVRVFAGLAMRMRLLQILGPARALRVAQAVARMGGPVLGVDWGRRDFLRRAGGALLGLLTLQGLGAPLRSGTAGPPIPSQSRPPSRRRVQRGEPLYSALFQQAQKQFRLETWNAEPDWKEVWLYSFERGSALVAPLFPSGSSHRFLTASVRGTEILALYVVEIEWEESASMTGRMRLYHPDGRILLTADLPKGEGEASRSPQNRPPGPPRPSQAICCHQPEIWICIAEGLGLCSVCCCYTPASCAACAAGVAAFCAAVLCYFC
jgi:hypothetical protein